MLSQSLPWTLVAVGAGIAIVVELLRIPSLPFAVGVYLPVSTMIPVFLGGLLRMILERGAATSGERAARRDRGILFGSGLVGGEGLIGVVIAGAAGYAVSQGADALEPGRRLGRRGGGVARAPAARRAHRRFLAPRGASGRPTTREGLVGHP